MKRSIVTVLLASAILCSLALVGTFQFSTVKGATEVSGIIGSDTTWTKANSPYTLTGNVLVSNGVTLTIQPGVSVELNSYYIMVNGTLDARGTSTDQISISSGELIFAKSSADWNESAGTGCIIENAVLSSTLTIKNSPQIRNNTLYGAVTVQTRTGTPVIVDNIIRGGVTAGLQSEGGPPTVEGNASVLNNTILGKGVVIWANATVSGNSISGISGAGITAYTYSTPNTWYPYSVPLIEGNLMFNNTMGIEICVWQGILGDSVIEGSPILRNNTITNNTIGIHCTLFNSMGGGPNPTILYNNIYNNSNYNIQLSLNTQSTIAYDVNATNNWWGTNDTQAINQTIYDFKNDFNLGTVTFVPFLAEPNPAAPAIPTEPAPNATYVSGVITSNTTWTLSDSPYVATGNVVVDSGVFLTVEPGVTVRFTSGTIMVIDGTLVAQGNSTHKIVFTHDSTTPTPGGWNGILVRGSGVTLDNVIVEYATIGIELRANATVTHGIFRQNTIGINLTREHGLILSESDVSENSEVGIRVFYLSNLEINNSSVTKNGVGIYGAGDIGPYSYVTAVNCTISGNTGDGLYLMGGTPGAVKMTNCTVTGNGGCGLRSSSRDTLLNGTFFCGNALDGLNLMGYEDGMVINELVFNCTVADNGGNGIVALGRYNIVNTVVINNNLTGIMGNYITGSKIVNNSYNGISGGKMINYSDIYGNKPYDLKLSDAQNVDATSNWWGTTNETLIQEQIYDYYDDYNLGKASYNPFLTESAPQPTPTPTPSPTPSPKPTPTPSPSPSPSPTASPTESPTATPSPSPSPSSSPEPTASPTPTATPNPTPTPSIPEFPLLLPPALFMAAAVIAALLYKKKQLKPLQY